MIIITRLNYTIKRKKKHFKFLISEFLLISLKSMSLFFLHFWWLLFLVRRSNATVSKSEVFITAKRENAV